MNPQLEPRIRSLVQHGLYVKAQDWDGASEGIILRGGSHVEPGEIRIIQNSFFVEYTHQGDPLFTVHYGLLGQWYTGYNLDEAINFILANWDPPPLTKAPGVITDPMISVHRQTVFKLLNAAWESQLTTSNAAENTVCSFGCGDSWEDFEAHDRNCPFIPYWDSFLPLVRELQVERNFELKIKPPSGTVYY